MRRRQSKPLQPSQITTKAAGPGRLASDPEPQRGEAGNWPTTKPAEADVQEAQAGGTSYWMSLSGDECCMRCDPDR